jgi:hypothetical protein
MMVGRFLESNRQTETVADYGAPIRSLGCLRSQYGDCWQSAKYQAFETGWQTFSEADS